MLHVIIRKDHHPYHLTKYEGKGTKISIFKFFSELGKIWKCNLSFSKIPISHLVHELGKTWKYTQPRPIFQNPNVEFMDELGKLILCPNLTITVENKMGNSYKRGWSHFKLKINIEIFHSLKF